MLTDENDFHGFSSMCSGELSLTLRTEYFIASSEKKYPPLIDKQKNSGKAEAAKESPSQFKLVEEKICIVLPQEKEKLPSGQSLTLTWECSV